MFRLCSVPFRRPFEAAGEVTVSRRLEVYLDTSCSLKLIGDGRVVHSGRTYLLARSTYRSYGR